MIMCLIVNGYSGRPVGIDKYKIIVYGNKEREIIVNLFTKYFNVSLTDLLQFKVKKVNQSHYRPGHAQRVPGS